MDERCHALRMITSDENDDFLATKWTRVLEAIKKRLATAVATW